MFMVDPAIFSILAEAFELLPTSRSTFISASASTTTHPPISLASATHSGVTACFDKRVNLFEVAPGGAMSVIPSEDLPFNFCDGAAGCSIGGGGDDY
jgi:hypothetical protein